MAAVVNGAVMLVTPAALAAYADYTSDAVRPFQPTLLSSAVSAWPVVVTFLPIAILVAWRTYVHARAYLLNSFTIWRGPAESAAIAGATALVIMVGATAATWAREPPRLVAAYIAFYVTATALVGLALGMALAATALLGVYIGRRTWGRAGAVTG